MVGRPCTGTPGKVYKCTTPGCCNSNGNISYIRYDPNRGDIHDAICYHCEVPFFYGGKCPCKCAGFGSSFSPGEGRAAKNSPSLPVSPQDARKAGVPWRTGGKGKLFAKGKGAGKGGKGGKGKGGKGKGEFGKGRRQVTEAHGGAAPRGAKPPSDRRGQLADKEARLDKMFATMQSFFSDLKDFNADKLSVEGFKQKAAQVCTQLGAASKPKAASSLSTEFESAKKALVHQQGQKKLLEAACTKRYKELQKTAALLQSITHYHLPEAKARFDEVAAKQRAEFDASVTSISTPNDDSSKVVAPTLAVGTGDGDVVDQLNRDVSANLGEAATNALPDVFGGVASSASAGGMTDGSKRCRAPTDDEEPPTKLSGPKSGPKSSIEGSELWSAAARGDDDGASDPESALSDQMTADPILLQLMSEAQAQVLTYGPVGARSVDDDL